MPFSLSDDEITLITSALPEVSSINCTNDSRITIDASSEIISNFTLTIITINDAAPRIKVTCSDDVDPLVAGDFEQFASREFARLIVGAQLEQEEGQLSVLLIELVQQLLYSFDPASSNPLRAAQQKSKPHNYDDDVAASRYYDDDDDDEEIDEEEQLFDDATDWSLFNKQQQDLKQQRILQQQQRERDQHAPDQPNYVVILAMHHIYCCYKRRYILELARDLGLAGVFLFGKPGRVIVEGPYDAVEFYSRAIRSIRSWKSCKENGIWKTGEELLGRDSLFEPGFGFQPMADEAAVKQLFAERHADKFFAYTFHFS